MEEVRREVWERMAKTGEGLDDVGQATEVVRSLLARGNRRWALKSAVAAAEGRKGREGVASQQEFECSTMEEVHGRLSPEKTGGSSSSCQTKPFAGVLSARQQENGGIFATGASACREPRTCQRACDTGYGPLIRAVSGRWLAAGRPIPAEARKDVWFAWLGGDLTLEGQGDRQQVSVTKEAQEDFEATAGNHPNWFVSCDFAPAVLSGAVMTLGLRGPWLRGLSYLAAPLFYVYGEGDMRRAVVVLAEVLRRHVIPTVNDPPLLATSSLIDLRRLLFMSAAESDVTVEYVLRVWDCVIVGGCPLGLVPAVAPGKCK